MLLCAIISFVIKILVFLCRNKLFILLSLKSCFNIVYHYNPKYADRQVWAKSVDPDQTAPKGAV